MRKKTPTGQRLRQTRATALPLLAATTTAAAVGLIVMHLAVAAVVIPLMSRTVSRTARPR